jgi:hypothetical protein
LTAIGAVVIAVVLGSHFELLPAEVEEGHRPVAVDHRYLRRRNRQAASINSRRSQVSFGDAAPPSIKGSAARSRHRPRAPW